MNLKTRLNRAFDKAVVKADLASYETAKLGRLNPDATVSFAVPGRPDFTYITKSDATVTIALNRGAVPLRAFLPVRVRDEGGGYLVIAGEDKVRAAPSTAAGSAYGVLPHPFTIHSDTPSSYSGAAGQVVKVKTTEDGLEFAAESGAVDSVNGQTGAVALDADDLSDAATTNKFVEAADLTKLAGIESLADVTDAANVAAAIGGAPEQATLEDTNRLALTDDGVLKRVAWSTIKATLTTLFNGLYTAINTAVLLTGAQNISGLKSFLDGIYIRGSGTNANVERLVSGTASPRIVLNLRATSNGSAVDDFGPAFFFDINDLETTGDNPICLIGGVRDGADNSGAMLIRTYNAGTPQNVLRITATRNLGLNTNDQFGSGQGVIGIANRAVVPTTNPTGGAVLYAESGALKGRGSGGTTTTIAAAEPHCPVCGADYVVEFENDTYGYFVMCLRCLADELGKRPWINWQEKPSGRDS